MDLENRKIDDFIENKLKRASLARTSGDFTSHLMNKVQSEYKTAVEEAKRDRIAKYIIGIFCSLILVITIMVGYLAKSDVSSTIESTNIKIEPTIVTSTNYFQQFITFIQNLFINILSFFGLTVSLQSVNIIAGLIVIFTLFLVADRIFLKGKLRSIHG